MRGLSWPCAPAVTDVNVKLHMRNVVPVLACCGAALVARTPRAVAAMCAHGTSTRATNNTSISISIIIPCLNEAGNVERCIHSTRGHLMRCKGSTPQLEVIVVDGSSTDASANVAEGAGAKVIMAVRGRGRQLNEGAAAAHGELLLFLHADSQLPADWLAALQEARHRSGQEPHKWGCFESIQLAGNTGWVAAVLRKGVAFRTRLLHMPYGDQAIFVDRLAFEAVGGFQQWRLLEDVDMVQRLHQAYGPPAIVPAPVQVSARRWQRLGFVRTCLVNQAILAAWACGVPPDTLARWYYGPSTVATGGTAGDTSASTVSCSGVGALAPASGPARGKSSRPSQR